MKRVFIVNPVAGKGKTLRVIQAVEAICKEENFDYIIEYTKEKEQATKISKKYSNSIEPVIIYSAGGDGTLNEVINGMVNSNAILGIIPSGTGNDFVRSLEPSEEKISKIDIGQVNHKYFINIASVGLDAEIANNANMMKKFKLLNSLVYEASIAYTLCKYKGCHININDELIEKQITLLAVCNGKSYGGGITIAPRADINDGLMDIYMVDKISKLQILILLAKLFNGTHESSKKLHMYRTNSIILRSSIPLVCNVDGEIIIDNNFNFSIINGGINVINEDHPKIMQLSKSIK